jgi:DmsE family decaheme c-type cytochrome
MLAVPGLLIGLLVIGLYAPAQAGDDEAAMEEQPDYVGTATCLMCHDSYKEGYLKTRHALTLGDKKAKPKDQGCEMCHGPGGAHMDLIGEDSGERGIRSFKGEGARKDYYKTCFHCHSPSKPEDEWTESGHFGGGILCASCHTMHDRQNPSQLFKENIEETCYSCHTSIKIQFETGRSHHPLKEETACLACHDPHGEPDELMRTETLEITCAKCHLDKVGPFAYQHLGGNSDYGEGCMNCHNPHASSHLNMLRLDSRALCLSCHTEMASHNVGKTCWGSGCHSQIHGSNRNLLFRY